MVRYMFAVVVFYLRFLRLHSFQSEMFKISDTHFQSIQNCLKRSPNHFGQFSFKTSDNESIYQLQDDCDEVDLNNLNFFPKCCELGYNYELGQHRCLKDVNSTNFYSNSQDNLLAKSYLDCPVIIDHILEEEYPVFKENRAIIFNETLYQVDEYCIDWDDSIQSTILRTCESMEACKKNKCITKCCREGRSFVKTQCDWNPEFGVSVANNMRFENRTDDFTGIIQAKTCKRFIDKDTYNFTINQNGSLRIMFIKEWLDYSLEDGKYCLEYYKSQNKYVVFICVFVNKVPVDYKMQVLRILNVVSCVSLALTILGYLFLRELKNFLGKIIIWYCGCLLLATASLTYGQFNPSLESTCVPLAFLITFFFLAAFAWMNVLSFEIWQVLGSMLTRYGTQHYTERKKLIGYHLYAWIFPILLLVFGIIAYRSEEMPAYLKPSIGRRFCLIEKNTHEKNYAYLIFFGIPSLIYILANTILFIKTIRYITKVKNDVRDVTKHNFSERQKRFYVDKERVATVSRIFIIMGLSWLFEFILAYRAQFSNHTIIVITEFLFDMFNTLQGFFIFLVFMAKKKIFTAVKQHIFRRPLERNNTTELMVSCSSK